MKVGDTRRKLVKEYVLTVIGPKSMGKDGLDRREIINPKDYCQRIIRVEELRAQSCGDAAWRLLHCEIPTDADLKKLKAEEQREEERKQTRWFFGFFPRRKRLPKARIVCRTPPSVGSVGYLG